MKDWQSLSHVKWICKYHIVFVTKYRKRTVYGDLRKKNGDFIVKKIYERYIKKSVEEDLKSTMVFSGI